MQIYGYHRTSTKEQHLDRGIQEIERYCNEHEMALTNIFTDQETGKNFNRPRYTVLVEDVLRPGDILIVTELDRLGRNKYDTMQQIQRIKNMGVRLMVLELPTTLMDLSVMDNAMARMMLETINNMMLELYASMAQAELEKKEKRQREGEDGTKYFAHTLNNTVVAPPRMLIAFLENNLQEDGSVKIPKALQPYMGGTEKLVPKK